MKNVRILNVGQCGVDGPRMTRLFEERLSATVESAANGEDAVERLASGDFDLVLVNRLLAANGASGLDVVEQVLEADDSVPVMLVSDLDEAQEQAVALGAMRGFGKAKLDDPATLELIKGAAGRTTA